MQLFTENLGAMGGWGGITAQRLVGYAQLAGLNTRLLTSIDFGSVRHGVNTAPGRVTQLSPTRELLWSRPPLEQTSSGADLLWSRQRSAPPL